MCEVMPLAADALDDLHEGGAGGLREAAPDINPDDVRNDIES